VIQGTSVTHLRYKVRRDGATGDAAAQQRAHKVAQAGRR
jgi:hypothetical protein